MEDIVHGYRYFENYPEFYWEPVKFFQRGGDMGPTTKAENEPSGCILHPLKRGVDTGRPTSTE